MSEKYFTRFASKNSIRSYMFQYQKIKICEIYQNIKKQIIRDKKFSSLQYLSQQTFVLIKPSWRHLEEVFHLRIQGVFKTSWSRRIYSSWPYVFKTSSRHFEDVFKMSCHHVFKTSCKNVFKTSSRRPFNFWLFCTFSWLLTEAYLEPDRTSTIKLFLRKYLMALSY